MSRARRAGREDGRRTQEEGERHQKFMHVLKTHTHTRHTRARAHTHTHTHTHTHREVKCREPTIGTWLRFFFFFPFFFSLFSFALVFSSPLSFPFFHFLANAEMFKLNRREHPQRGRGGHSRSGTAESKDLSERTEKEQRLRIETTLNCKSEIFFFKGENYLTPPIRGQMEKIWRKL